MADETPDPEVGRLAGLVAVAMLRGDEDRGPEVYPEDRAAVRAILADLRERYILVPRDGADEISDGYHTFGELYRYRRLYNAALFNEWAAAGRFDVHKSWRHSDGEPCFGGGWFIVCATLPTGLVTNHYKAEHWDEFRAPPRDLPVDYDGHTPADVADRLAAFLALGEPAP